jgi:hypothetical protein
LPDFAVTFAGLEARFHFFGIRPWWIRPAHVCLSCSTISLACAAPRPGCRARAPLFLSVPGETLPNRYSHGILGDPVADQLMP